MSRRRAIKSSKRVATPPASTSQPKLKTGPPIRNLDPNKITIKVDDSSRASTPQSSSIQQIQADKVKANLANPANARGMPEDTLKAFAQLMIYHEIK